MSKQVYISADYSENDGDREVVKELNKWGQDNLHKVDFIDMSQVASGSVSKDSDCRICDLKKEFNAQINASSAVIFVVGDKTALRTEGSSCRRVNNSQSLCSCTPYKQNTNGTKPCKVAFTSTPGENDDVGCINSYSYLKHEFKQAEKRNKKIIIKSRSKYQNKERYESGRIVPNGDDLLLAFAKLDKKGLGRLTRDEYLECLTILWEEIDTYYGQTDVCIPILGSGLTRFDGGSGASISQQELLNMMIWSYKLSSHKIKLPHKLRIICKKSGDFSLNKIDSQI